MPMSRKEKALVSLTPAQSKRVIARAVAEDPLVQQALERGLLIVTLGTTNAFVVEALTGEPISPLRFAAGVVQCGRLCPTPPQERAAPLVLLRGERSSLRPA
jgi:hypothetical protein